MPKFPTLAVLLLIAAMPSLEPSIVHAAGDAPSEIGSGMDAGKLALAEVPALRSYLKDRGYLSASAEVDLFRTGPDGESLGKITDIYAIQYLDAGNCGSAGCTQIIVTKDSDGAFLLYEEWLGTGLTMLDDEAEGVRNLVTRTEQGILDGRFNGTKYVWSPRQGEVAGENSTVRRLGQTIVGAAGSDAPAESSGQCVDDRVWHGYANGHSAGGGGALGYGLCRTNRDANFLLFTCKSGKTEVDVKINQTTRRLDDSDPVEVKLTVDGQSFDFKGTAFYDVMSGEVQPEMEPISLDHPVFAALEGAKSTGTLAINGQKQTITLSGAPGAAGMMRQACLPPPAAAD
jgi:hypothetical protein